MKELNKKAKLQLILILILLWAGATTMTQRFKCPKLSETELFLMLPENIILNFKDCN